MWLIAMLFKKKQQVSGAKPVGFTKRKQFLFFKIKSKPIYGQASEKEAQILSKLHQEVVATATASAPAQPQAKQRVKGPSRLDSYFAKIALKHRDLEIALREVGVKESVLSFIKRMFFSAVIISIMIAVAVAVLLLHYGLGFTGILLSVILGYGMYITLFQRFLAFPLQKSKALGKGVEKDILFAARDLVVSLRSGMPLFNAITAVSTGYGDASKEFAKIVELVQLGMPIEQAIDRVSEESQSKTFKRIMLQASVSIKSGADIVGALQGVVNDVTEERVIELRRYGQKLNALAMFYMLFGVIFPSMGIAVAAILTTFINIFTVNFTVLLFALVFIFFLQLIFLNVMKSSRPIFTM